MIDMGINTASVMVFVSGANGYIAQHVVKQLLAKGYTVVGSVRSESKGDELKLLIQNEKFSYEVIPTLSDKNAFDAALKKHPEVTVFLHTASPVSFAIEDVENDLVKPAIEGTLNALRSIKEHAPQITRVVITSSAVAMWGFGSHFDGNKVHDELDWSPITYEEGLAGASFGYKSSKKYAELAAHDFMTKEKPNFAITYVHPTYTFGPQAYVVKDKKNLNLSNEIVNQVIKLGKDDEIPEHGNVFADVRDVAQAHIVAFESDEAIGQRLLLASGDFTLDSVAEIINRRFPHSNVPRGDVSRNEEIKKKMIHKYDNSKTRKILGFEFKTLEESIYDMVEQLDNA
ncbi:uncharacterized protein SPAPADRAFT_70110 [Spathaspora passalidarum NRRL Y-27907]|uniref:NAD-dependent epimerase/dehydratase domain-containing protein n=1 Tax=Spathaspora passalidarum (strain NRRL Y-27907 / 11-Y1) TaxID=619300 RepID=G3AJ98_SPAPN|nr:uncharacterized protein SPAPADRAFT_70110 [Spathaspora passalidarum NRRL Y-27907]EGW33854.1 hypothetical protein SPAPADRAFT_70110 [Spathaspora passalidarum NRRL Y-27907]